uniref:Sas10 C-terminal domain-containing protein n=1 Tax=Acrobeloides nanus TaxID=290746 RepID=A0A914EB66_9BILA
MDDDDNIYDEIDRFNMEKDVFHETSSGKKRKRPVEVLSVNVEDESDVEEDTDFEADSDAVNEDQDIEKALPSTQKWGKKRHAFYGSYADADYGGVNDSEEEELLELEEEDAIARQKKADAAIAAIDYDALDHNLESDSDDDAEKTKTEKLRKDDFSSMSEKEQLEYFLKTCPEVEDMIMEYQDRTAFFDLIAKKLMDASEKLLHNAKLRNQLRAAVAIYTGYLTNLFFYLKLKCSCQLKDLVETSDHPVVKALNKYKKLLKSVDDFTTKVFDKVSQDPDWLSRIDKPELNKSEKPKKSVKLVEEEQNYEEIDGEYDGIEDDEFGKRGVSYEMAKNRGADAKRKRSKDLRHSRVRKRKQFDKALIRRRSQVPDVKRELTKYDGEKRGIKINTVRSIKLKA